MESYGMWLVIVASAILVILLIRRFGTQLGCGLQLASLIRFQSFLFLSPLIIAVLSCLIVGIFENLVNVDDWVEAFLVSWIAFDSSWFCLAMVILILDHAEERFAVEFEAPPWFWNWSALIFLLPPVILMARVYASSPSGVLVGLILGWLWALVCAIAIDSIVHFLDPPPTTPVGRRFIFSLSSYPSALRQFFQNSDPLASVPPWLFRWVRGLGPGYIGSNARPYPDQIAVTASAILAFIMYTGSFYFGLYLLKNGHGTTYVPVLAYLEFLVLSTIIVLAGAAFFLDRFRVPVLTSLLIYSIVVSTLADTDHYWFASRPNGSTAAALTPSDGIKEWLAKYENKTQSDKILTFNGKPLVVVVCASGGGIEAAAWTTRVLKGLYEQLGPAFIRSVRLISSTSGGSVGSLYFIQSYFTNGDVPSQDQFENIWKASTKRSLDATGWGFAHPDFARLFFPIALRLCLGSAEQARKIDRGWALEQSWRVALKDPQNPKGYIDSSLSDWRGSVAAGVLPGTVFNATIVETGDPLLLSTVRLNLPQDSRSIVFGQTPTELGADISNVTAARLSASFPYVSPVAKGRYIEDTPLPPLKQMHIADGGYYDNFGVTVAVEWIKQITEVYGRDLGKIIIIRIDAFPEDSAQKSSEERSKFAHLLNPQSGWGSEVLGPVKTVLNSRSETQYGRDIIEFDLLKNVGGRPNSTKSGRSFAPSSSVVPECDGFVNIVPFVASHSGPLSWQLSDEDKRAIERDWSNNVKNSIAILKTCLANP